MRTIHYTDDSLKVALVRARYLVDNCINVIVESQELADWLRRFSEDQSTETSQQLEDQATVVGKLARNFLKAVQGMAPESRLPDDSEQLPSVKSVIEKKSFGPNDARVLSDLIAGQIDRLKTANLSLAYFVPLKEGGTFEPDDGWEMVGSCAGTVGCSLPEFEGRLLLPEELLIEREVHCRSIVMRRNSISGGGLCGASGKAYERYDGYRERLILRSGVINYTFPAETQTGSAADALISLSKEHGVSVARNEIKTISTARGDASYWVKQQGDTACFHFLQRFTVPGAEGSRIRHELEGGGCKSTKEDPLFTFDVTEFESEWRHLVNALRVAAPIATEWLNGAKP